MDAYADGLKEAVHSAITTMAAETPLLTDRASLRLPWHDQDLGGSRERLFAVMAAGAMGGRPAQGLPVAATSTLWWTGVDIGYTDATVLALRHISTIRTSKERKMLWMEDVVHSTSSAAETALAVRNRHFTDFDRQTVLSDHLGVHGAAYARDAVMTARICAAHAVERWRKFGLLYGLLRKLTLDHSSSTVDEDANPSLVVPDLLMAHACAATQDRRLELAHLRRGAARNERMRATLRDLLRSPRVVKAYYVDLRRLHHRACAQLDELEFEPLHGAVLRSNLDETLKIGPLSVREVVGL